MSAANPDVEAVGKAVRELRVRAKDDFSLEIDDTLGGLCNGDRARTGAALWQLFRDGENVIDDDAFAKVMAKAPKGSFTAADLLAYLAKVAALRPRWIRLNFYDDDTAFEGWTVAFELMLRSLDDLAPLVAGWKEVAAPVQSRLAVALARRGALPAADLPNVVLEQAARDYLVVSMGRDEEIVVEGLETVWPETVWRTAVVAAALGDDVEEISLEPEVMSRYLTAVADADFLTIAGRMGPRDTAEIRRWYRERADTVDAFLRQQAEACIKRVKNHEFLTDEYARPFVVHAQLTLQETGQLDERFDPVLLWMVDFRTGGVRKILEQLPEKRRERLLLKAIKLPGTTDWDCLTWFPSSALARHCVDEIVDDRDERVEAYYALSEMGDVGARVVCELFRKRRKTKRPIDPDRLGELLLAFEHARLPEVVDECLLLVAHRADDVRESARERLFVQSLEHMLPRALLALLASKDKADQRLAADYLVRWSHDARARAFAAEKVALPQDALARARLTWAANLEPALGAVCARLAAVPEEVARRVSTALSEKKVPAEELRSADGFAAFLNWFVARRLHDETVRGELTTEAVWELLAHQPAALCAAVRWSNNPNKYEASYASVFKHFAKSPEAAAALAGVLDAGVLEGTDEIAALELVARLAPERILGRLEAAAADAGKALRDAALMGFTVAGAAVSDSVIRLLSHRSPRAQAVAAEVLQRVPTAAALPALDKALTARPAATLKAQLEIARDACRILAERAAPPPAPTKKTRALAARGTAIALDGPVSAVGVSKSLVLAASSSAVQLARRGRTPARLFERAGVAHPFVTLAADERCFAVARQSGQSWLTEAFTLEGDRVSDGVPLEHDDGLGVIVGFPGARVLTLCIAHNAATPVTLFSAAGKQLAVHERQFAECAVLLPDPSHYLLGEHSGRVSVRDAKTGAVVASLYKQPMAEDIDHTTVSALAVFDGARAAALAAEVKLVFLDLDRRKKIAVLDRRSSRIEALRGAPDAPWLFASTKTCIEAWSRDGRLLRELALAEPLTALVATPRGAAVVAGRELRIWNPESNTIDAAWTGDAPLAAAAGVGRTLCVGDERGAVHEIDLG